MDYPEFGATSVGVSERLFRLFVDAVKEYAIFMIDPKGVVMTWNAGAELLKGYEAEEIIGQHFSRFYRVEDQRAGLPQRMLESAKQRGRVEAEGWRVRKDGTPFWADVVMTALYDDDGTLLGFGKVTRDLTERRKAEDLLRKANEELERRVTERTADLQQRIVELEQFHDLVVQRELKMIELEKRLSALDPGKDKGKDTTK